MNNLQNLAAEHPEYLSGDRKESEVSLSKVETSLQVTLPEDVKWFLKVCGYGQCHAVPNIQSSISDTQRFRRAVSLPNRYVVLDDRNDAGAVLLDTESSKGTVLWVDTQALSKLDTAQLAQSEHDAFPSFAAWVSYCLEEAKDENAT